MRKVKNEWAIITVQGIIDNDFYIGTLRQGKYTRRKINGADVKQDASDHKVFEHHHQEIVDYRTFATARALREERSTSHYRGVKINDNVYSGFLFCGDCGSPMFAMSRRDIRDAYRCGEYHRRGRKACTSHHIRVDKLDELVKDYVRKVKENSAQMLDRLNADLARETEDIAETEKAAQNLTAVLDDLQAELKATKRQRVRDIMKHPEQEALLEETYDEMESDLSHRIEGIRNQIDMSADKRNTIIQVNRVAKTAIDLFRDILEKGTLERGDLEFLIDKILVFEDHLEIRLQSDIDTLLRCGTLPAETEDAANFNEGTENIETTLIQSSKGHEDKVFRVHVISNGDPLEIYTEKDGEVIFKKYSPMGDLGDFAGQICESIGKNTGYIAAVCDRDAIIAVHGVQKRELLDKRCSQELEQLMELRRSYRYQDGDLPVRPTDGAERYRVGAAAPIVAEGDLMGCVLLLTEDGAPALDEAEQKLVQTVAGFLGRQMES